MSVSTIRLNTPDNATIINMKNIKDVLIKLAPYKNEQVATLKNDVKTNYDYIINVAKEMRIIGISTLLYEKINEVFPDNTAKEGTVLASLIGCRLPNSLPYNDACSPYCTGDIQMSGACDKACFKYDGKNIIKTNDVLSSEGLLFIPSGIRFDDNPSINQVMTANGITTYSLYYYKDDGVTFSNKDSMLPLVLLLIVIFLFIVWCLFS
jgi:hypothetical protein